jgi:ElaB/YqjD/DUF883 family membrane-anchored ribosome-binding protein
MEGNGRDLNGEIRSSQRTNFKYAEPSHLMSPKRAGEEKEENVTSISFWDYIFSNPFLLLSIAAIVGLGIGYLLFSPEINEIMSDVMEEGTE